MESVLGILTHSPSRGSGWAANQGLGEEGDSRPDYFQSKGWGGPDGRLSEN